MGSSGDQRCTLYVPFTGPIEHLSSPKTRHQINSFKFCKVNIIEFSSRDAVESRISMKDYSFFNELGPRLNLLK